MAFSGALRRCLSTSSLSMAIAKTPIKVFGMEGRYASALYSAAVKQNKLDTVEKEIRNVEDLYRKDAKFKTFVLNPTYARLNKKKVMVEILKKLNASELSQNFFAVIADNGRLNKVASIFKSFNTLMGAHRGELTCEIITAKPLDAAQKKELDAALQGFVKSGQKLNIQSKVDPSIVGGMIVTIGDRYVDMSIASKLRQLENAIKEAV